MSHNHPPIADGLAPAKPTRITLDTLPQLFAHHRALYGGHTMVADQSADPPADPPADPQRPDGITEEVWDALGDPGRRAIVQERQARQKAEHDLAAARARPAPPKPKDQSSVDPPKPKDQPDIAALVQQAVSAAVKPLQDQWDEQAAQGKAEKVMEAVRKAAEDVLHDSSDALGLIDLTTVVDDHGAADPAKVKTALEDLVKAKPHLAKPVTRYAPPGIGGGRGESSAPEGDRVKAHLAAFQRVTGAKQPAS